MTDLQVLPGKSVNDLRYQSYSTEILLFFELVLELNFQPPFLLVTFCFFLSCLLGFMITYL